MLATRMLAALNTAKNIIVSSNTTDLNLFVLAGSPTKKGNYNIIINSGVLVGQVSAAAAVSFGNFISGSKVKLINKALLVLITMLEEMVVMVF